MNEHFYFGMDPFRRSSRFLGNRNTWQLLAQIERVSKMAEPAFKRYTDLIQEGTDLLRLIKDQGAEISGWLGSVSESQSMLLHAPYTWTLKEVVNHLSDCERVFSFRALWIARGGTMPLVSFDENEFSARAKANDLSMSRLAAEFHAVRSSSIALFETMPAAAWACTGQVIGHEVTVHKQATILLGHVAHHWGILKKRFVIA